MLLITLVVNWAAVFNRMLGLYRNMYKDTGTNI